MNTTENNKLIAEFMELEKENGLYLFTTPMDDYKTDTLYFNSSWDWLMPVVRKCWDIAEVQDYDSALMLADYDFQYVAFGNIEKSYKAVVEFIKYYNENKED